MKRYWVPVRVGNRLVDVAEPVLYNTEDETWTIQWFNHSYILSAEEIGEIYQGDKIDALNHFEASRHRTWT